MTLNWCNTAEHPTAAETPVAAAPRSEPGLAMLVFSGDMDKLLAAFMVAVGAASSGMAVTMFFSFWALAALKKKSSFHEKSMLDKILTAMLPSGCAHLRTSRMNFFGLGSGLLRLAMRQQKMASLQDLLTSAQTLNVRLIACTSAMQVMGVRREELLDGMQYGGVQTFLDSALAARATLFI